MIASSYEKDEQKSRQLSLLLTIGIVGGFLIGAYFWVVVRGTIPPADENPYIVVGRIDFGGPGGNPPPGPPSVGGGLPSSAPTSPAKTTPAPQPENLLTSPNPSPVKSPSSPAPSSEPAPAPPEEEEELETFQPGPGEGAAGGGTGADFQFGDGTEGLQNRRLLYFVLPRYTVQKEARIKFEVYVLPDGRVSRVRALSLQAPPELKRLGEEALLQWRFNPIATGEIQRMTVTIRFRLR